MRPQTSKGLHDDGRLHRSHAKELGSTIAGHTHDYRGLEVRVSAGALGAK